VYRRLFDDIKLYSPTILAPSIGFLKKIIERINSRLQHGMFNLFLILADDNVGELRNQRATNLL